MPIETFASFTPVIDSTAFVHTSANVLGEVTIEEECSVWPSAVLRGDHGAVHLGPRSNVQDGCVAHGTEGVSTTVIGAECTIGHRAVVHGCRVADHCLVGIGSVLLDNVQLGEWCFVGAGTLLTPGKRFEPRSFILGSPGRRVREISAREQEWIEYSWRAYVDLARRYRR